MSSAARAAVADHHLTADTDSAVAAATASDDSTMRSTGLKRRKHHAVEGITTLEEARADIALDDLLAENDEETAGSDQEVAFEEETEEGTANFWMDQRGHWYRMAAGAKAEPEVKMTKTA